MMARTEAIKSVTLNSEQMSFWLDNGYLVIQGRDIFTSEEVKNIRRWTSEVEAFPEIPGKWMKYFENSSITGERIISRLENFFPYHENLANLVDGRWTSGIVAQLMGCEVILFKEKINFKHPGGTGFKPHQDAQARWDKYGHSIHVTVMISVDHSTPDNGCLEVVPGMHNQGLIGPMDAPIPDEVVDKLTWIPCITEPGDLIVFDSFVPHRSGPNLTGSSRRVMYVTYNKASEGDFREQYYTDKRKSFPPDCEREAGKNYEYKI